MLFNVNEQKVNKIMIKKIVKLNKYLAEFSENFCREYKPSGDPSLTKNCRSNNINKIFPKVWIFSSIQNRWIIRFKIFSDFYCFRDKIC